MKRAVNLVTRDRMVANKVKKSTNSQFGVPQSEAGENSAQKRAFPRKFVKAAAAKKRKKRKRQRREEGF